MKTDLQAIDDAINLLSREGGWCKGKFEKPILVPTAGNSFYAVISHCMEGAVYAACGLTLHGTSAVDPEKADQSKRVILKIIKEAVAETGAPIRRLAAYNDADLTTKEDVLLVMKKAREEIASEDRSASHR